jgi:hypothetical protein
MKWAEAPKNIIQSNNEEVLKTEENMTVSQVIEEAKNQWNEEEKKENSVLFLSQNSIHEEKDENTSDEKCVDIVINENDDTMVIQEKLKENIEESKVEYNSYYETTKENKQEPKSFNLQEEIERSEKLDNHIIDIKRDLKDLNTLIPVTNNISLNKSINQKIRNKIDKPSQDSSIIMYDYSSNRTDKKDFNNYAQIKQYIIGIMILVI